MIPRINCIFLFFTIAIFSLGHFASIAKSATDQELANISLRLYTGKTVADNFRDVLIGDAVKLLQNFDFCKPTVFYIHGFSENLDRESVHVVVGAYLKRQDHNIVGVDWGEIAAHNYAYGALSAEGVGKAVAKCLKELVAGSLNIRTLHIIGHSLGSQIAGYIGRNVDFKIPRITGLDPAGPGFYAIVDHLKSSDAEFVDVIHTDSGFYGISVESGGADFYPNNGIRIQPGCPFWFWPLDENDFCSHHRSWVYYAESVTNENSFIALECDKSWKFKLKKCRNNKKVPMGFAAPFGTKGSFYLETRNESPYGRGKESINSISRER